MTKLHKHSSIYNIKKPSVSRSCSLTVGLQTTFVLRRTDAADREYIQMRTQAMFFALADVTSCNNKIISVIFLSLSDFINFRLVARRYLSWRFNALCVSISSESRNLPVDKDLYELLSLIVIAIMHINVFILVTIYFCIIGPLNNCTCRYIFRINKKLGPFVKWLKNIITVKTMIIIYMV